jgi:hypothetical protein
MEKLEKHKSKIDNNDFYDYEEIGDKINELIDWLNNNYCEHNWISVENGKDIHCSKCGKRY